MTATARPQTAEDLARAIRLAVLEMTSQSGASHIGTCFSMAEIMGVLYSEGVPGALRIDPQRPDWPARDRFVLSKGHGCAALYAALAERGFFPREWLQTFYADGGRLFGHVTHKGVPGVEASTGSLGHGLPIATGMALFAHRTHARYRVVALLSDGECDEGSTWEAALFAAHHGLDNLVAIVDYNKVQSMGATAEILNLDPLAAKWEAFGWGTREIDGHDVGALSDALDSAPFTAGKPSMLIAHTVKGKGVSFMQDDVLWHYRAARGDEYDRARAELDRE